jgi:hypothetical protein
VFLRALFFFKFAVSKRAYLAKPESAVEPGDEVQLEGLAISPQCDAAMLR